MNKFLGIGFLGVAFYEFSFEKNTQSAIYFMCYAILFSVFDAREEIKKVNK